MSPGRPGWPGFPDRPAVAWVWDSGLGAGPRGPCCPLGAQRRTAPRPHPCLHQDPGPASSVPRRRLLCSRPVGLQPAPLLPPCWPPARRVPSSPRDFARAVLAAGNIVALGEGAKPRAEQHPADRGLCAGSVPGASRVAPRVRLARPDREVGGEMSPSPRGPLGALCVKWVPPPRPRSSPTPPARPLFDFIILSHIFYCGKMYKIENASFYPY